MHLPTPYLRRAVFCINILVLILTGLTISCSGGKNHDVRLAFSKNVAAYPWCYEGIGELQKGDIIVKPNLNILPGTEYMPRGWGFGHAAIVTRGAMHSHPDSLLMMSIIFESHARDVPQIHQLREIQGYVIHDDPAFSNENFGPRYTGDRYRLRLNIRESQIDSIIDFVRNQKGSSSSWNAMKRFPGTAGTERIVAEQGRENWADNSHWYCSLLIWQAVFYVTGIDLDANGGYYVYPSDLITSPHFDNTSGLVARARF
jgi:hypothetical protein